MCWFGSTDLDFETSDWNVENNLAFYGSGERLRGLEVWNSNCRGCSVARTKQSAWIEVVIRHQTKQESAAKGNIRKGLG